MAFLDLTFPRNVALGARGGPRRRTDIAALGNGREERNSRWADSRRVFNVGLGIRSADQLAEVVALWQEARGAFHSFRFRDWSDFSSAAPSASPHWGDQLIGTGDGAAAAFQLAKVYGSVSPYAREITKPVAGSVSLGLDGAEFLAGWSVDPLTGVVTFVAPPAVGVEITAGFLFDVPVRFEDDALDLEMAFFDEAEGVGLGGLPPINLVEVIE